uniref:Uncharacterized protein n=1 Tax=Ditylenchus dipsaci TaxID=166011 RepID=A0A915DBN6_9BILA
MEELINLAFTRKDVCERNRGDIKEVDEVPRSECAGTPITDQNVNMMSSKSSSCGLMVSSATSRRILMLLWTRLSMATQLSARLLVNSLLRDFSSITIMVVAWLKSLALNIMLVNPKTAEKRMIICWRRNPREGRWSGKTGRGVDERGKDETEDEERRLVLAIIFFI